MKSFDKYKNNIFDAVRKEAKKVLKRNYKEIKESLLSDLFKLGRPIEVKQLSSPHEIFFSKIVYGFNEINISFKRLLDLEIYVSRFPYGNTSVSKTEYLLFQIENYLSEMCILKERLKSYFRKIERSYKKDLRHTSTKKICDQLINEVEEGFKNFTYIRGIHIHKVRYHDKDIERVDLLDVYAELINDLKKYLPSIPNYEVEYRKVRKKWKKIFKDNNEKVKILLNGCFKEILKIVFTNDGEIFYPEKYNFIKNDKSSK